MTDQHGGRTGGTVEVEASAAAREPAPSTSSPSASAAEPCLAVSGDAAADSEAVTGPPEAAVLLAHLAAGGDPFDLVERPDWFSYTAFDTFERCPRRYALRYLCRQPEQPIVWPAAEFGAAAHAAFEAFTRERRERAALGEPPPTRAELGGWLREAFDRTSLASAPDAEWWLARAQPMLDLFWSGEQPAEEGAEQPVDRSTEEASIATASSASGDGPADSDSSDVASVRSVAGFPDTIGEEMRFGLDLELDEESSVRVTGFIDRVDRLPSGEVEVIDYKSGNGWSGGAAGSLQLAIYALGCRDALGLGRPSSVSLYFVEAGLRARAERTDRELDDLRLDLSARARAIRSSTFAPTPGDRNCRWCEFAAECDATATKAAHENRLADAARRDVPWLEPGGRQWTRNQPRPRG